MRIHVLIVAAMTALAGVLLPVASQAAPPTIQSVGQTSQHPSAAWMLPVGGTTETIQVASDPRVGSDGSFFTENIKASGSFYDATTSWLDSTTQLVPGTYYVHVSGLDPGARGQDCPAPYTYCLAREYSAVVQLVIPVPARATKAAVTTRLYCSTRRLSVQSRPVPYDTASALGRTKLVLGGIDYRKTVSAKAGSTTFFKLKPGKYTLTARYLGHSDAAVTYLPSKAVVRHLTIKRVC